MVTHTTSAGKVKVGLALNPHAHALLKQMAAGPRKVGALLDELICAEAARRERVSDESAKRPSQPVEQPTPMLQIPLARRDLEQKQADVLAHITEGVITLDPGRHVIGLNRAAEAMSGWTAEEAMGRPVDEVIPREPVDSSLAEVYRQLDTQGGWRGDIVLRRRDGTLLPVEATGAVIKDAAGQVVVRIGVMRDISERKQAETKLSAAVAELRRQGERLRVLHEIDQAILAARSPREVAEVAAEGLLRVIDACRVVVSLWRTSEDSFEVLAWAGLAHPLLKAGSCMAFQPWAWLAQVRGGQAAFDDDLVQAPDPTPEGELSSAQGIRSHVALPLVVGGQVIGHLDLSGSVAGRLPDEELALARQVADSLAIALHHARLNAEVQDRRRQLQALSRRLVELQEQERRALSRDLHDTSGQNITALKLGLATLKRANDCSEAVRSGVDGLLHLTDVVAEDLHRLAVNLRPASLDRYGLVPALEQLLTEFRRTTGLQVEFLAQGMEAGRLPPHIETALYRIAQEATTNCARYAQATCVSVMIRREADNAQLIVEDDGQGFDVEAAQHSGRLGLLGMRERAEMLGGRLDIESRPNQGTCIYASMPELCAHADGGASPEGLENPPPVLPTPALETSASEPNARLATAAELARAKALSDALVEITAAAARCANADEILHLVLARSAEAIGCENAHIALRDGDRWELHYGYREGLERRRFSDAEAPAFVWVERTRQALVVNDTGARDLPDDALRLTLHRVKSYASIPLLAGDSLIGVLSFANYSVAAAFHASEVEFLNRLTKLVALALENARLHEIETRQRDELAQRVEELQTLVDLVPLGIAIARDPECKRIDTNPANARMLGIPANANASVSPGAHAGAAPFRVRQDGRDLLPDELPMQLAATGREVRDMYLDVIRSDGQTVTMLAFAVPLFDAEGKPRGAIGAFVDLTAQRQAQAEAEEARRTLEALMEFVPEGLTIANAPDLELRYVSRYGQDLLGGPHQNMTAGDVAAQWPIYEPDGVTPIAEDDLPLARAIRRGETVRDRELVQVDATGRGLSLLCNAAPIRDAHGTITGGIVAWRDISTLKEAQSQAQRAVAQREAALDVLRQSEEQLRLAEERARDLIRLAPTGIYEVDLRTGRFRSVNDAMCEILGYSREELLAMSAFQLLDEADQARFADRLQRMLAGEQVDASVEYPVKRRGGGVIYGLLSTRITYRDRQPDGVFVIAHDVTERRRIADALRRQQEQHEHLAAELDATLSSIADGLVIYDVDGKIVRMNATAQGILGYSPAERELPMAERIGWLTAIPADGEYGGPETLPVYRAQHGETVQGSLWIMTRHSADPSLPDRQRWISTSAAPIRDASGHQIGTVASFMDVTALHEASEAVRQARDELGQRVQARTAELVAANAELFQKEAALRHQATVLENVQDAIIAYDMDLRITAWNHRAEAQYGWTAKEALGGYAPMFVGSQTATDDRAAIVRKVASLGTWKGELRHTHRNGTPIMVETTSSALYDEQGSVVGHVTANRDITARKQAEALAHQQNQRLELLLEIDRSILAARAPEEIAQAAADKMKRAMGAMRVGTALFNFATQEAVILAIAGWDSPQPAVGSHWPLSSGWMIDEILAGRVATVPDVADLPDSDTFKASRLQQGVRSAVMIPMMVADQVIGQLTIHWAEPGMFPAQIMELAIQVADSLSLAIHNARLHKQLQADQAQLQALSHRLVQIQERERSYVADRLYNEAAQVLAALKLQMGMLARDIRRLPESTGSLGEMTEKMDRVLRELNHLAGSLRPAILDRLGLVAALRQYLGEFGRQHGLAVECRAGELERVRLPGQVETALYRLAQEALANVAEHAQASHVNVALTRVGAKLLLAVQDDGRGFDVQEALRRGALGLVAIRERTEALGGSLEIESMPGSGTTLVVEVPLDGVWYIK